MRSLCYKSLRARVFKSKQCYGAASQMHKRPGSVLIRNSFSSVFAMSAALAYVTHTAERGLKEIAVRLGHHQRPRIKRFFTGHGPGLLYSTVILFLSLTSASAQLPFYTDDADTTPRRKFHLEVSNQYDWLQKDALPGRRQNTTIFTLNYGVTNRVELGVNAPFIRIFNERSSNLGNPSGIGDIQFGVKVRLFEERERSKLPAGTLVFYVEAPTGDARQQIGSGLTDYHLYGVLQKSLTKRTTGRLNGGIIFAGNGSTGFPGIRGVRGQVFTGNGSLVREFTPRLRLGAELFGAVTSNFRLSRGQLVAQVGGGYALRENLEFTFGVLSGRFPASPRAAVQIGLAYDLR
ncbi:MAG TPA: transporter [Pyrinomonadaceae bacterium]|nr:transporter [Pyrinomonadaceae bacterium]